MLVDRRDSLGRARTETLNRLPQLLLELVPGGATQFLSAPQARVLLNTVWPRDIVERTRRHLASELITEVAVIDKKIKAANAQLTELVDATGSTLCRRTGWSARLGTRERAQMRAHLLVRCLAGADLIGLVMVGCGGGVGTRACRRRVCSSARRLLARW